MINFIRLIRSLIGVVYRELAPIHFARSIGVRVGKDCRLIKVTFSSEPYLVTLGDHVSATKVHFETHDGGVWVFRSELPDIDVVRPINIGNNVFIGFGTVIMPGVTVGDNVVIGAGSVVTKDIPHSSVAVGVPARVIKRIDEYKSGVLKKSHPTKNMSQEMKRDYYLDMMVERS